MAIPRAQQVDLDTTPYYHCVSRCVRRAFLCGRDPYLDKDFNHRRGWVVERLILLADIFAIDVCAYAVMSNHLHLVLRVDAERVATWTDAQVEERATRLFSSAFEDSDEPGELRQERLTKWRDRLVSLSWFMRCLNEWIARHANEEDGCKGRFWEGRFKSQALLDEGAVLACMSYVDLNPIRAGMADSLEAADFTSIQARLSAVAEAEEHQRSQPTTPLGLLSLVGERRRTEAERLDINLRDYTALLDWTGRSVRDGGSGVITGPPPKLLERQHLNPATWLSTIQGWGERFWDVVGEEARVRDVAQARGQSWCKGKREVSKMYGH